MLAGRLLVGISSANLVRGGVSSFFLAENFLGTESSLCGWSNLQRGEKRTVVDSLVIPGVFSRCFLFQVFFLLT